MTLYKISKLTVSLIHVYEFIHDGYLVTTVGGTGQGSGEVVSKFCSYCRIKS